jgi:poly-gamma-glutamate capsule biosynthesis protein CapA/YwtB (metallophosphatase superfamily)
MPSAWIDHLQTVLDSLSEGGLKWIATADGDADLILSSQPGADMVNLAHLAAVVPVGGPLLDIDLDSLRVLLSGKIAPNLPGWRVKASREIIDLSGLGAAPAVLTDHAGALEAALNRLSTIALVRWETPGWPLGLRPLRIKTAPDADPGYFALSWAAAVATARPESLPLVAVLKQALSRWSAPPVEMMAVGDIMLGRSIAAAVEYSKDAAYPFRLVESLLNLPEAVTVGNLECVLTAQSTALNKRYTLPAPPSAVEALSFAGFDVLSLGNNHAMDFGAGGLADTLAALDSAGIAHVGAGTSDPAARTPAILERGGLRFAFLAYVNVPDSSGWNFKAESIRATADKPGVAWADPEDIAADVRAARARADFVIVFLHSGIEYNSLPNVVQRTAAHAAIDAGATLVLGTHPHVLQGIEYYHGGLIAYSLGNFVFDMHINLTAILRLWIGPEGMRAYAWEPIFIAGVGRPQPASPAAAVHILETVNRLTYGLNEGAAQ